MRHPLPSSLVDALYVAAAYGLSIFVLIAICLRQGNLT